MKKMFLRVIALVLTICAMQVAFVPAVAATSTAVTNPIPLPVVAQEMVTYNWKDGVFSAITKVGDHDYIALPIYGGRMYIYDLYDQELVDVVWTDIGAPRGATVDRDGNIWVAGDAQYLYMYDPETHIGKKTQNFDSADSGLTSVASAYAITYCEKDNCLYFGTSSGQIAKYDIDKTEFFKIDYSSTNLITKYQLKSIKYATAVLRQGDYIYASMHNGNGKHYLAKLDASTYRVVGRLLDISAKMGSSSVYLEGLSMLDDTTIVGTAATGLIVDTTEMKFITKTVSGSEFTLKGNVSEAKDGKVYFVTYEHGLCAYNQNTKEMTHVYGSSGMTGMRSNSRNFVTLNVNGVEGEYLLTYYNSKTAINAIDLQNETSFNISDLVAQDAGAGTNLGGLMAGLPGTNKVYMGAFQSDQIYVYNTSTDSLERSWTAAGIQTDALHWYNSELYAGNYKLGQLTKLDLVTNQPTALVALNDDVFDQARMHTITSGDNKVFAATVPDVGKQGSVIAWYDYDDTTGSSTGTAYAAVGRYAEDVFFLKDGTWYNEKKYRDSNGKILEERASGVNITLDDTGIEGVIEKQSIISLAYDEDTNILFGTSSRQGGSEAGFGGDKAVLFAYDVDSRTEIAKIDSFLGMSNLNYIGGVVVDPDVPGTFWGVAAETLFSFTFDESTKTFTITEKLSFSKTIGANDGGRCWLPRPILFAKENGVDYIYVAFSENGNLCKIEKANPQNHEKLLTGVQNASDIPIQYTLSDDGALYYLDGPNLCMLNVNPTDEEWQRAQEIDALIANAAQLSMEQIKAIRTEYDALPNRVKSLVQNAENLSTLEVDATVTKIAAIGEVTKDSGDAIKDARNAYDDLKSWQQITVTNYSILVQAEMKYKDILAALVADVEGGSGEVMSYATLEEAFANVTAGDTVRLRRDITATSELNMQQGVILDLNGNTLTATSISGTVMDSQDGEGLIKLENAQQAADLKTADNCLVLWDNTTGNTGYRVFSYTFTNLHEDADGTDANESEKAGMTVKSFWSDLTFNNERAYTIVSGSDLQVGFKVSWTPDGGEETGRSFVYDSTVLGSWGDAEYAECVTPEGKNYCFYIRLTGFERLKVDGTVTVKPYIKTTFNVDEKEATVSKYDYVEINPIDILKFEQDFGEMPAELSVQ